MRNRLAPILAVLFASLTLTACAAGISKNGPYAGVGEHADALAGEAKATGEAVTAAGITTGNPLLIGLGALLSTGAATWLAYRKDASDDAAPFTPEDAASIEAAKAHLAVSSTAPALKPVTPA